MSTAAASPRRFRPTVLAATGLALTALLLPGFGRSEAPSPYPPDALGVVRASPSAVTLEWESTAGASRFTVIVDGRPVAATRDTTYTVAGLSCSRTYTLGIASLDGAGRASEARTVTVAPAACPPREAQLPEPAETPNVITTEPEGEATSMWHGAGAFVWHETDVSPEELGARLRGAGFGWVVVLLHDGTTADPVEDDWVRRFRDASGLPVGGWGVLRTDPQREAELAHELLERYELDFYVANAEAEYKYSGDDGQRADRFERSARFVEAFRALEPDTPTALSSYCRADMNDIDWSAWSAAGFAFLPQAYVNDFGDAATPEACLTGAQDFFEPRRVHPTVGVYESRVEEATTARYAELLESAGTLGFSVYLAETRMHAIDWNVLAAAIDDASIAVEPGAERAPAVAGRQARDGTS